MSSAALLIVADPDPSDLDSHQGLAYPKNLPMLVAAAQQGCVWLVTFNLWDYQPGIASVTVLEPGDLPGHIRSIVADLDSE